MENKVFERNIKIISTYNEPLARKLKSLNSLSQDIEIVQTEKNEYNLKVNGAYIHSQKGATDEAKNIVKKAGNVDLKDSVCVIFGLGLGYLLDEFFECAKGGIILFEPNTEILKCTFEMVDLSHILLEKRVKVVDNINDLNVAIEDMSRKETKISISFLNSYLASYENEIKRIAKEIEYTHGEIYANERMIKEVGKLAIENTINNIKYIKESSFIGDFKGCLKGKTALIVSAGPSLSKNIETIKKYSDKFVIFSVGASYKTLIKNDIIPEFLSIIEPRNTIGQVEGLDISKTTLILEPYTHTLSWELPSKNKIVFMSHQSFLNDLIAKASKIDNSNLKVIGTVSYCSLLAAQIMGADNIILIGQDLAYSNSECYAKGSAYEELKCVFDEKEDKYKIIAKDWDKYLLSLLGKDFINNEDKIKHAEAYFETLNKNLYTVIGQNGEKMPTQTAYALFIKHFEDFAKTNSGTFGAHTTLINSSTGGAQIEGFKNIPLEEIAKQIKTQNSPLNLNFKLVDTSNLRKKFLELLPILDEADRDYSELINIMLKIILEYKRRKILNNTIEKLFDKLEYNSNLYKAKYNKYDNIVNYIVSAYFTDLIKIIRTKNAKIISEKQDQLISLKYWYSHYINEFKEKIKNEIKEEIK